MEKINILDEADKLANLWNKTKDPKYKDLWYKYIKEWSNGSNTIKRWNISSSRSYKTDDDRYKVIK